MMRSRGAYNRSEAGFAGVLLLAAFLWAAIGGTAVGTLFTIGQRLGWGSPAGTEIAACVKDVETALVGINAARALDPNKELDLTDPNVVVVKRCQALAETLANDPAFGGKAQALGRNVNRALSSIAECALYPEELEQQAIAGRDYSTNVRAKVPLVGLGVKAQATISGGGVSSTVAIDPTKTSSGILAIPGANSKNVADKATSSIGLTASGVALDSENKPVLVRPDGTCPFGLPRVGDECRISCTVTLANIVTWKAVPKIEVELSASNVDPNNASLTWTITNSKSQKIQGPGIPSGSAGIGPVECSFPVKRGQQEETYTITASAPDTDSVTKSVPVAAREGGRLSR